MSGSGFVVFGEVVHSPDGMVEGISAEEVEAINREIDRQFVEWVKGGPDRFSAYVSGEEEYGRLGDLRREARLISWMGTEIGKVARGRWGRGGFGSRRRHVEARVRVGEGFVTYYGWEYDSRDLVHLKRKRERWELGR